MRKNFGLIILTLVVTSSQAHGRPGPLQPKFDDTIPTSSENEKKKLEYFDVRVSPAPPVSAEVLRPEYYPYKTGMAPRFGYLTSIQNSQEKKDGLTLGLTWLVPKNRPPQWELGADLFLSGGGIVHGAWRTTLRHTSYLRPFYKYGLAARLVPKEGLASIVNYENYILMASAGLEKFFLAPSSFRGEMAILIGLESIDLQLLLGYVWAW